MSLASLLDDAKAGRISPADVRGVVDRLCADPSVAEAYTAICILGHAGASEHRDLVASFLDAPADPMVARIALHVLVSAWGLGSEYRDRLCEFVAGVEWDEHHDVRHVALAVAGEFAWETGDRALVAQLLEVAEDEHEDELTTDIALAAVARAVGCGFDELWAPSTTAIGEVTPLMLQRAREFADGS